MSYMILFHYFILGLPGAFQSSLHGVLTCSEYAAGVQSTIRAGGDSCSRAGFIGACLAAQV